VYVISSAIEGLGVGFVFQPGNFFCAGILFSRTVLIVEIALVALQSLSSQPDMAVTTSSRNWIRALGSAVGVAVSTALQYGVMKSALPTDLPASVLSAVLDGSWKVGQSPSWEDQILDAKMKGLHSVFIMFVPLMGICLFGCILIRDQRLLGDGEKNGDEEKKKKIWSMKLTVRSDLVVDKDKK
jgi:hypothetical protein